MTINLKKREDVKKNKTENLKKSFATDGNGQPLNFHWKNDDAQKFIDFIVDESANLLASFRVVPMSGPTKEIAKIVDTGKLLRPAGEYKRTGGNGKEGYQFGTEKVMLTSKKVEGLVYISDDELEDNIEGKSWEEHVMQMCAKKIANEIVEAAIYGRALENPNGDNGILNVFNGIKWLIKKYGNVVDANGAFIERKHLIKAKKVLKTKYRKDVKVLMDSDIKTDLDELYNDPNGNKGNGETVKTGVSGMPIMEVPLMSSDNAVADAGVETTTTGASAGQRIIPLGGDLTASVSVGDSVVVRAGFEDEMVYVVAAITASQITTTDDVVYDIPASAKVNKANLEGADSIITNPKNIVIGIERDVKVELERVAPDGYNTWYTMRKDIVIENPEAAVLVENLKSRDID